MRLLFNGRGGKVGSVLAPLLEANGHTLVDRLDDADAMVDFTTPGAALPNVRAAVDAGVPSVVGTSGWDTAQVADAPVAGLLRAELRDRRRADDALRRRSGSVPRTR